MNIKQLIRSYNSCTILDQPLGGISKETFDFLAEKFAGLNAYKDGGYPDYIFYGKTRKDIVIDHNLKDKTCFINKYIWLVFLNRYGLTAYEDIRIFMTWYIVNILQFDCIDTLDSDFSDASIIDDDGVIHRNI
jgi:hypothetical protein